MEECCLFMIGETKIQCYKQNIKKIKGISLSGSSCKSAKNRGFKNYFGKPPNYYSNDLHIRKCTSVYLHPNSSYFHPLR